MRKLIVLLPLLLANCTTAKVAFDTFVGSPSFDVLVAEALNNDGKVSGTAVKGAAKVLAQYCKVSAGARSQIRDAVNKELTAAGAKTVTLLCAGDPTPLN